MKIRFSGFGGQGIVMCGFVFGKAAMLDGKSSIQTQSYGSASRGGLTRSDVGIESGPIHDLVFDELDVLVTMSQQSYDKYRADLRPEGMLFYESDLVRLAPDDRVAAWGVAATDVAYKRFERKIMANMIMMGLVNRVADLVSEASLRATIKDVVPAGTEEKNIAALTEGMRLAGEAHRVQ